MEQGGANAPRRLRRTWNIPHEEDDVPSGKHTPALSSAVQPVVLLHVHKQQGQQGLSHSSMFDTTREKDQSESIQGTQDSAEARDVSWNDMAPLAAHRLCKTYSKPATALTHGMARPQQQMVPTMPLATQALGLQTGKADPWQGPLALALQRQAHSAIAQLQPALSSRQGQQQSPGSSTHSDQSGSKPSTHGTEPCSSSLVMASLSLGIGPGKGQAQAAAQLQQPRPLQHHSCLEPVAAPAFNILAPAYSVLPGASHAAPTQVPTVGGFAGSTHQACSAINAFEGTSSQLAGMANVPVINAATLKSSSWTATTIQQKPQAETGLHEGSAARTQPSPALNSPLHAGMKDDSASAAHVRKVQSSKELLASIDSMVQTLGCTTSHSQADNLLASIEQSMRHCTTPANSASAHSASHASRGSKPGGQASSSSSQQGMASLSSLRVLLHKVQAVQAVAAADAMQALQTVAGCEGLLAGLAQLHTACTATDRECAAASFAALNEGRGQWRARAAIAEAATGGPIAALRGSVNGPAPHTTNTHVHTMGDAANAQPVVPPAPARTTTAGAAPQYAELLTPATPTQGSVCQQVAEPAGLGQQPGSKTAAGGAAASPSPGLTGMPSVAGDVAVARRKQRWRVRANPMYEGDDEWHGSGKLASDTAQVAQQVQLQAQPEDAAAGPASHACSKVAVAAQHQRAAAFQEGRSSGEVQSRPCRRPRMRRLSDSLEHMWLRQSKSAIALPAPAPAQSPAVQRPDAHVHTTADEFQGLKPAAPVRCSHGSGVGFDVRSSAGDTHIAHSEGMCTAEQVLPPSMQLQQLVQQLEGLMDSCYLRWLEQVATTVPVGGATFEPECRRLLLHMQQGRGWLANIMQRMQQQQTDARAAQRRLSGSWAVSSPAGKGRPSPLSRLACNSPTIGVGTSTGAFRANSAASGTGPSILATAACTTPQAVQASNKTHAGVTAPSPMAATSCTKESATPAAETPGRVAAGANDAHGVSLARLAALSAQLNGAQRALTTLLCRQRMAAGNV